ncbi:hypothetical protein MKX01_037935, partial [Papaver californicum]
EDTLQALESREDQIFWDLSSLKFISANSENMAKGRHALQDLHGKVPVRILKSNEYLQVRNDNPEILSPMCCKSANLDNAYSSVEKRMESWECKRAQLGFSKSSCNFDLPNLAFPGVADHCSLCSTYHTRICI